METLSTLSPTWRCRRWAAVLQALNIRLFPEQLIFVANHATSQVLIVDNSLAAPFSKLLTGLVGEAAG